MLDKLEKGPLIAAAITAAASLITYGAGQIAHIDERLDRIERLMQDVHDGNGNVRASQKAISAFYQIQAHEQRIKDLEDYHQNGHPD